MEAVKESKPTTNGKTAELINGTSPEEAMRQVGELLQAIGYDGLGVVAIGPRTGSAISPLDFMPEGWRLVIVPTKREANGNPI